MFGIFTAIAGIGATIINGVSTLAASIGGAVSTASHLLPMIPSTSPLGLGIRVVVEIAARVIPKIAEILVGKPSAEMPEELGMKAEKADFKLEDCNNTEEYIQRLRNEIHLDKDEMEKLSEEDRAKYAIISSELYMQSIEERYDVKLGSEFLSAVTKADMMPERISNLILALRDEGVKDGASFDRYLSGKLESGSQELLAVSTAHERSLEKVLHTDDVKTLNAAIHADIEHYRSYTGPEETQ